MYVLNRGDKCPKKSGGKSDKNLVCDTLAKSHKKQKSTGSHIGTSVLNEAFADTCSEDGQTQLTVALWFMYTVSNSIPKKKTMIFVYRFLAHFPFYFDRLVNVFLQVYMHLFIKYYLSLCKCNILKYVIKTLILLLLCAKNVR